MYNILVVDYSALMRKFMCDIIQKMNGYQVADVCADGETAYRYIKNKKYDAVTLSMTMPTYNGVEILKKLKDDGVHVPIIAISSSVKEDRELALKAMELGVVDFVLRPLKVSSPQMESFSQHLVKSLNIAVSDGTRSMFVLETQYVLSKPEVRAPKDKAKQNFDLIAIASSTGGPQALQVLVPMLSKHINVPIVIVQHMPKGFTASLAERIDIRSKLTVKEAEDGEKLQGGYVYIAPGGHHLRIAEGVSGGHIAKVGTDPPVNNLRPCADVMFESLVNTKYDKILCAVLTGMGSDGMRGISALKKKKNIYVITQDKESSVVYGMPKAAYEYGLSNAVCDIQEMASMIAKKMGV